jgi:hypothetical protein
VILAEARIPENTLRYTEQLSGKPTRVFIHELEINKRQVTCYSGQISGFEALFLKRLRNGERILLTSDSQRQLEKLERLIQQEIPHIKTMRNDHNTAYLTETKELTISPNQVLAREQLQILFYSPGSKSGWDLTGQDNQGNQYEFDRVMAIFRVLPTSDQIQMIARYRPDCPWDIYLSETIQVTGDETNGNPRKLSRQMEEEAKTIALGWNIPYDPSNRPPLEKFARDHYVVATARAGLEKRINYYSMVQRLIEDGHTVTEEKLGYHKKMADRMRLITSEIEREWADLIASIKLSLTDTIELAKKLEQLEAPNPEQRAKAEKILLVTQHPGIDFDHPEICYQTTRSHKSLVRGVDLEAATHNIQAVAKNQKKATTEHFEQSIIAVHHLPHKADRAYLMLDCGILEMLTSGKIFSSSSPEVLELMRKILAKAKDWKRYFSFNFTPDQPPISFLTRAARCLAIKFHTSRPGTKDRPRQYQVYTTQLIDQLIAEGMEKLDEVRSRYANKTESELDRIVEDKSRAARLKFFRQYGRPMEGFDSEEIFNEVISLERVDPLAILTADHHEQIEKLLDLRNQVKTRTSLLQAVLDKYLAATSTISINGDSYIEKVDEKEQSQKTTQKTVLSLLDFANS